MSNPRAFLFKSTSNTPEFDLLRILRNQKGFHHVESVHQIAFPASTPRTGTRPMAPSLTRNAQHFSFLITKLIQGNTIMDNRFEKLYRGTPLSAADTETLFQEVFEGRMAPELLASLLTALKIRGETPEEIRGAASAMIAAARPFPRHDGEIGEIVGTGGDGSGTINISTTAALAAAACGLRIAKHGNRGVSSPSGASDVLSALGIDVMLSPEESAARLEETGFAFCFAQAYHPAMRFAAPVRKALGTRTIFNILGPLTNPARPDYGLFGVYDPSLLETMARTLRALGMKRAMTVYGCGLDEAAVHGITQYVTFDESGVMHRGTFTPGDFGVTSPVSLESLRGGTPAENAVTAERILAGQGTYAQTAVVAANLALLLLLGKRAATLPEAVALARSTLLEGKGLAVLEAHRAASRTHAEGKAA